MSLIHDALKKADKKNDRLPKYAYTGSIEQASQKRKKLNWGPIFILLVLALVTGPIIAPVFSSPFKNAGIAGSFAAVPAQNVPSETRQLAAAETSDQETRKAQFGVEEAPLAAGMAMQALSSQPPSLRLSGLVYSDTNPYCLINDKVVKPGDSVGGAKLVRIGSDEVELDFRGQKIILSL